MPLNLQANDGDFVPFIKYNAKAGRWYIRVDGSPSDTEIVNPVLAFDMANIRTGWLFYMEGVGPEKIWDPSPGVTAPKPPGNKAFKRGFEVLVHGKHPIGVREFSSTAGAVISPLLEMYAAYEQGLAANPGKVPIYACTGVNPITGKHGTNYSPIFKLQSWADRATIPFDGGPVAGGGPGIVWVWTKALEECSNVGITEAVLKEKLKAKGLTSYNAERDTATVMAIISAHIESKMAPPPSLNDDIPF